MAVDTGEKYPCRLPLSRLGIRHKSLASYLGAISVSDADDETNGTKERKLRRQQSTKQSPPPTEFSLVVILSRCGDLIHNRGEGDCNERHHNGSNDGANSSNISILLGKKLRGFGSGFYTCFGGKLQSSLHEYTHPAKGAVRELEEECGIQISLEEMEENFVGKIHFTFEDDDFNKDMLVHLFCVFISLETQSSPSQHATDTNRIDMSQAEEQKNQLAAPRYHSSSAIIVPMDQIRGCDEIEPVWFHNIHYIPLHNMFADDSIWLTVLLDHYNAWCGGDTSAEDAVVEPKIPIPPFMFNARFHFHAGGTETNSIMHYFIQLQNKSSLLLSLPKRETGGQFTLEQRLFHELHTNNIHSPSIKEFKENWAMANSVRTFMKDSEMSRMEYVLDVAGGHGALAALFLLLVPSCHTAIVIDPAECNSGKFGVREAWSRFWSTNNADGTSLTFPTKKKELSYRHECLRTGLRRELGSILRHTKSINVTIVACHACQHLTDDTLQIASEYGVNVAVMPCCQKDHDGWWKNVAKGLVTNDGGGSGNDKVHGSLSIGALMDILAAGKMMSWNAGLSSGVRYCVKMKLMDASISSQNRMILCKALAREDGEILCEDGGGRDMRRKKKDIAHARLTRAYHRAHRLPNESPSKVAKEPPGWRNDTRISLTTWWCVRSLLAGVCIGTVLSLSITSVIKKKLP